MSRLIDLKVDQVRALFAGFVSMLIYGSSYTYGTLVPYLTSYIYYESDSTITPNKMALLLPISILVMNVGMPIINIPALQFSNRVTTLISIVGVCGAVFWISFGNQFWHFLILYGILFGLFIGYGYMAPIKNCYEHIPQLKGLCSGVCILGFGIASLLFNFILLYFINPDNAKAEVLPDGRKIYNKQVAGNVPFALRIMSVIYLGIGLLGIWLMRAPTQKEEQLIANEVGEETMISEEEGQNEQSKKVNERKNQQNKELSLKGVVHLVLKKKIHWLALTLTCSVPFGMFVAFTYKQYGMVRINDDQFLTTVGSCGAVCNGLGRLVFGMLFDRFSYRLLSGVINSILLVFALTLSWMAESRPLYLIAVSVIYFVYGGNYSIYPTHTVRIFGSEIGGKVYFMVFTGFSLGCVIQWLSRLFLVPSDHQAEGFRTCFYIFAGMNLISLLLSIFIPYEYKNELKSDK